MTLISNALPPSTSVVTGPQSPQQADAIVKTTVETPAVILSISGEAASGNGTKLQYAISGVNGAVFAYNNADYARIAARDGADIAAIEKASLLHAAESDESYLTAYAGRHGLSTGSPITFDAIKPDSQLSQGSAIQAVLPADVQASGAAAAAPSSAPFSAAAADADVALATLTSPPLPAKPPSAPSAIGSRVSTSV